MVIAWIKSRLLLLTGIILASALVWGAIQTARLGKYQSDLKASEKALRASEDENANLRKIRAADSVAVVIQQDTRKAIAIKEAKGRAETIKAIEANPEWANQPVPRDILDSLRP